jgi:hypothetical protein
MAAPTAIVTELISFTADGVDNVIIEWEFQLLFCGPDPLQEQGSVTISDASTKAQIKTAINNVMIASAAAKGYVLAVSKIYTVADICG